MNKILLVEDDKGMLQSLQLLFEHSGLPIDGVTSLSDALDRIRTVDYDVVITDLVLPDGDGFELMDYCSRKSLKTKVIAMTGHASLDSVVTALRRGAYDYVVKPFDFDVLKHAVKKALETNRLKDEITKNKERYSALVEYLDDGFFILQGTTILYANEAMSNFFNMAKEELIGRDILEFVVEEHRVQLRDRLEMLLAGVDDAMLEEFCFKSPHAETKSFTAELKLGPSPSDGGGKKLIGLLRDVSERKRLWEQLVQAEKLAMMGEMVAGIAHELNNKLTPILAYVDMLTKEKIDSEIKRKLSIVFSAALGAKSIVEGLLLFSRQEKPRYTMCDVNQLLDVSKNLVSASFRGKDIVVLKEIDERLPLVKGDPVQLEQVFSNIIKNAYEALGDAGQILVRTYALNGDIVVDIEDTGPGIPKGVIPKIFEPFYSTKGRGEGTGLGLSVCYGIVKEHGGDIGVCANGKGTRFSIVLPAAKGLEVREPEVEERPSDTVHEPLPGFRKSSVLVVEDEHEIAELLKEVLSKQYDVELAKNGLEAIEAIKDRDFDVILSDIRMPNMDGIAFYHRLREIKPQLCKRVVYSTGVTCDDRTRRFFQEVGADYIKKPFRFSELLGVMEKKAATED